MNTIYIITIIRDYKQYATTDVVNKYFGSEEEAKKWLERKYAPWIDLEHLYIYYSGLWRFRVSDECGIIFSIKQLKAA